MTFTTLCLTSMLTTSDSPQIAPTEPTQSERFHALDAVRAFALILGIFFHGVMAFVSYIPKMVWAIRDSQQSIFLDTFFFVAHSFRMQAFFLIAGYFAHLLYHRQGAKSFLNHRFRRIFVPFLLFLPFIYFLLMALWIWGYQLMGLIPKESPIATLSPWLASLGDIINLGWYKADVPIAHLWFLYYLMLFCLSAFILRPLLAWLDQSETFRIKLDQVLATLLQKRWGGLVLGMIMVLPMQAAPGWGSLHAPDKGFIPKLAAFSIYGIYFTVGWLFHRQPTFIINLKKYRLFNLIVSLVLLGSVTGLFLTKFYAATGVSDPIIENGVPPFTNSIYGIGSMTAVFAFIGFILHYFSHPSKRIRYLSDSAYWLYIAHLPVVVFFQILVAPLQIHWLLKMPLIFVPSFAILFLSYHYGVRNTWLGVLLNGRRYPLK